MPAHPSKPAILAGLFLSLVFSAVGAEPPALPVPEAGQILQSLKKEHPRLLLTKAGFAELKQRVASDPQLKAWEVTLHKEAEEVLSQPPSKYEIPDGKRLLATSRRVLERVSLLAMMHRLHGDPKYADRAWRELDAAAQFKDWNPSHFLDTAEMTHAFAIGYDWLYDTWTADQREVLKNAMIAKGLKPARALYEKDSGYVRVRNNWNQVCNGGIGMGALAIADVEPDLAGYILRGAIKSLPRAMVDFAPDGGWNEGPGYWDYATTYNIVFLAALDSALGTDFGLSALPGFLATGWFPIYVSGPFGRTFNYADGGDGTLHAPQMFWLARKFDRPEFAWYARETASPSVLDLVWYDARTKSPKEAALPLGKVFRETEFATLRSDWQDPNALFIGLKAGDNRASHGHLDLGSFVLDALGERWAFDSAKDDYNLPGYFGAKRWDYYRLRAEGQNTLVINPGQEPDQLPTAKAAIVQFQPGPGRAFAVADLTKAYAKHASKVHRGVSLVGGQMVLIQDEIQTKAPAEIWWFMHTDAAIKVDPDGRAATLSLKNKQVRAHLMAPPHAKLSVMKAEPLPASPKPEKQANNSRFRKLAIQLESVTQTTVAVLMVPDSAKAAEQPKVVPLSEW